MEALLTLQKRDWWKYFFKQMRPLIVEKKRSVPRKEFSWIY